MATKELGDTYDIICIGSGMGSLTVASLLSQFASKKILVIEKHFQPGGYTHSFSRKQGKFHWDVGIHYVGDMHVGGGAGDLLKSQGTGLGDSMLFSFRPVTFSKLPQSIVEY